MATDISTLGIAVKSDDIVTASDRLNKLESQAGKTEQGASKLGSTFDKLGYSTQSLIKYIEAAAAALALMELAKKASEAALLAARYETLGVVMKVVGNNAGYTSGQMEEFQKGLQKTGISAIEARQGLVLMGEAHVDMAKSAQLARVAQDAAVIANTNSSEAFNRMMTGISTGQAIILHHMGLMVNFEKGYKDLADTLGKSKEELTEVEKTTARVNEVMRVSTGISGSYEAAMSTAGKAMNSLKRYTDDLKVALGEAFTPALKVVVDELTRSLQEMNQTMKDNRSATQSFGEMLGNFVSGSLNYFKKDLIQISALLADMKSGMLLLGSFVTFGDNSRGLKADADAMSKFAASQREYLAAMRAADNGQSALDPSDQMKLKVAQSRAEYDRMEIARKARQASEPPKDTTDNSEISHYNRYAEAYNRMVDAIAEGAPTLTAEEKAVQKLKDQYEKLFIDFPEHIAELKALEQAHMQQVLSLQAMQQAIKDTATEFQALFSQWENTAPEHSAAGEFSIVNEEILKLVDSLSGQDKLDEFNDNLRKMEDALSEAAASAPDKVEAITRALQLLKDSYADSSGLTRLQSDNKSTEIGLIQNQFDQKQALIEQEYQAKKDAYEKELALATTSAEKREALERALFLNKQKYDQASADNAKNSINSQLSMFTNYAGTAANLLDALANSQDKSSRSGFEAAKKYSLAAAVMNTAAAIVNALATANNIYVGVAMAAMAAATGAVQIAKIQATTYGGGNAGVAPVGSFNSGSSASSLGSNSGIGSMIGTQYSSVYDQQTQESLQALADSADNASLAIGKVADGLTSISSLFDDEGSYLSMAVGALPSSKLKYTSMGDTVKAVIKDTSLTLLNPLKSITDLFSGKLFSSIGGIVSSIGSALFGGSWYTKSAGLALSMSGGVVDVDDYLYKKKDGGLFGKTKKKYVYSDDDVWTGIIQTTIDSIASTINHAAVAMGTTSNFSAASLGLTRIQTTGRSEEDIAADLQTWLESASNALAKTVDGLEEYTFYNENAFDALVRLSTALQDTNEKFELIGATLLDSTLAGANSAYKLQQLFGSADAFDKAINTYFTAMFTDFEQYGLKAAQALRQVNTAFGEMDISVPTTRAEFVDLVDSLDTSTESGAALFAALMNISTAFGTVQDQIDAQTSQTQDLTTRVLTAMGYSTESDLYALKIQQQKELTEATQKGLDVTALAIVQQVEYAAALMKPIKTMSTALHDMIDSAVTYTTKQAFSIVSAALTSGNLSNTTQLTAAAKVLNGLSSDGYSTALDYQRGQALANVMITNLAAMADNQISDAEKTYMVSVSQLNALTDITTEIQGLRNEVRAVATATGKALTIFDKWDGDGMPAVAAG